ncbi:MAG: hypothetical protein ACI87E_003915 [Mariniblastus sp.]|jgi:hypothetical protein
MNRRAIHFEELDHAVAECERLSQSGYVRNGNWSLGQICNHIRLTIDANMDGYPRWMSLALPLRPILRRLMLPRLMRGDSPSGIKTAGMFVPPADLNDASEIMAFADCVNRFHSHTEALYPHPGFGRLAKSEFEKFHAAHAAHHLSFLGESE